MTYYCIIVIGSHMQILNSSFGCKHFRPQCVKKNSVNPGQMWGVSMLCYVLVTCVMFKACITIPTTTVGVVCVWYDCIVYNTNGSLWYFSNLLHRQHHDLHTAGDRCITGKIRNVQGDQSPRTWNYLTFPWLMAALWCTFPLPIAHSLLTAVWQRKAIAIPPKTRHQSIAVLPCRLC